MRYPERQRQPGGLLIEIFNEFWLLPCLIRQMSGLVRLDEE
jgi:hypothetical protein